MINCRKEGDAVKIDGIQFATNSPSGRLAHDLMAEGFLTDMSVETYGPWPDESDDTYYKAKLIGLSVVVVGNSKSARVKKLVRNSLAKAKEDGLDTAAVEAALEVDEPSPEPKPAAAPVKQAAAEPIKQETPSMFVTKKNGRDFAIKVTYKNAAGETVATELAPGASVDVSEDQGDAVETQINQATAPAPDQTENIKSAVANAVKDAVEEATKPLNEKVATLENAFDDQAKEPEFFKTGNSRSAGTTATKLEDMTANERTTLQLQSVAGAVLGRSLSAMKALEAINQFNLDKLKEAGKVENSMTLTDFGNFVVGPENLPGISDRLSNYTPLLSKFKFQETLSLNTAWLEQGGEIEMEDVDMEDHGDNENLKPISEYETNGRSATLKEFAAVTPVDASLIRFSAADIMASLNKNYNNAYDKALAKSVIGRLEKTVEANGHSATFDYHTAPVEALIALLTAIESIADDVSEGTVALMSEATRLQLLAFQLRAGVGVDSAWSNVFTNADQPRFFNRPYLVVPSNLLPKINSAHQELDVRRDQCHREPRHPVRRPKRVHGSRVRRLELQRVERGFVRAGWRDEVRLPARPARIPWLRLPEVSRAQHGVCRWRSEPRRLLAT